MNLNWKHPMQRNVYEQNGSWPTSKKARRVIICENGEWQAFRVIRRCKLAMFRRKGATTCPRAIFSQMSEREACLYIHRNQHGNQHRRTGELDYSQLIWCLNKYICLEIHMQCSCLRCAWFLSPFGRTFLYLLPCLPLKYLHSIRLKYIFKENTSDSANCTILSPAWHIFR